MLSLMKKHEASGLVEQFKGKTVQEAEVIAALLNPVAQNEIRDRVKVVAVKAPEVDARQATVGASGEVCEKTSWFRSEVNSKEENVVAEKLYHVSFAANEDFMKQLERAKELSFQGNKDDLALQNVLGKALGEYLKRRCPKEREARRQARREKKAAAQAALEAVENLKVDTVAPAAADVVSKVSEPNAPMAGDASKEIASRYVPAATRDEVLVRDGFCCTFESAEGVRCGSRNNLEVDHIVPFAVGGETKPENLRTLCAPHNLRAAYEVFPKGFMDACVERRKEGPGNFRNFLP